jgi:uncharacterized protein HemX
MRILLALVALFAGFIGYGAYRQHQVKVERERRAAALQDSLRRADSLQQVAEAEAARTAQLEARQTAARVAARQYVQSKADRPKPLKLQKPKTRVVVIQKPVRTNRRP